MLRRVRYGEANTFALFVEVDTLYGKYIAEDIDAGEVTKPSLMIAAVEQIP